MTHSRPVRSLLLLVLFITFGTICAPVQVKPGRDPNQAIDQNTQTRFASTTAPHFNSPLTDYLPASPTCRRRKPCSATSPARPASCPTPKTFTSTCGCWSAPVRA